MSENLERKQANEKPEGSRRWSAGLILFLLLLPVACGYGGWKGADFLGWDSLLLALGLGLGGTSAFVAVSWSLLPGRYEDGRLQLRSLLAVVVVNGILGGALLGLYYWAAALALAAFSAVIVKLFGDADNDALGGGIGAVLGVLTAAWVAWKMRRQRQ